MKAWIDISVPGRHGEQHRLDDAGTTLGASSSADVRLQGVSTLLAVHCSLRPQREGCWLELIEDAREPFVYDGRPAREALIAWGHDVYLGGVRITVNADLSKGARSGPSPLVWVALGVVPLLGLSFMLKPSGEEVASAAALEPPPLFGEMPSCAEEKAGALGRANVAEQLGSAKHERGVFNMPDAVEAVQLMREAAVCYALGDNQGSSDRALDTAEAWIDDLKYSLKRAQLDLKFSHSNLRLRLNAAARMNALLKYAGPAGDDFRAYLSQLKRDGLEEMAILQEQAEAEKNK